MRQQHLIIPITSTLALLAACADGGGSPSTGDLATVQGRLSASGTTSGELTATLASVDDDGATTALATASIAADGHFSFDDVAPAEGPFVVHVDGAAGVVGSVVVPGDLVAGGTVTTTPIDHETTIEAQALVTILAGGAARADVDPVMLTTWIDARLAAAVEGGASLAAAFESAQAGWLAVLGADASTLVDATLAAHGTFAVALDAATTVEARADAWRELVHDAQADVAVALDVPLQRVADASAAAAVLFEAGLAGDAAAREGAARIGAELAAHAQWAAQLVAASGSGAEGAIAARLEAGYTRFFDMLAEAPDRSAVIAASASLAATISSHGPGDGATSALELLITAEGDAALAASVDTALAATAEARAGLEAALDSALAGPAEARAAAVASAWITFRADVTAAIDTALGADVAASVEAFVTEVAAQLEGHLGVVVDVDLIGYAPRAASGSRSSLRLGCASPAVQSGTAARCAGVGDIGAGLALVGAIAAGVAADATIASLLSIDASGAIHAVASGTIGDGTWRFEGVTETGGVLVVELTDAGGELVGAARLDAVAGSSGTIEGATITLETTVEAAVMLARIDGGERPSTLDGAWLELLVDGAVAAAASTDEAAITALAQATLASEIVHEAGAASSARAHVEATLAFALALDAATGDAALALAGDVRAHIEAALALQSAFEGVADGSSFASFGGAIQVAVADYIGAAAEASSQVEADAAQAAFVDAMLGFSGRAPSARVAPVTSFGVASRPLLSGFTAAGAADGGLLGDLATSLGLDAVQQATLESAITATFAATTTFELAVAGALDGALDAGGAVDGAALADAWLDARGALDATLATTLALPTLTMSAADRQVFATLMTQLALGFEAAP